MKTREIFAIVIIFLILVVMFLITLGKEKPTETVPNGTPSEVRHDIPNPPQDNGWCDTHICKD